MKSIIFSEYNYQQLVGGINLNRGTIIYNWGNTNYLFI